MRALGFEQDGQAKDVQFVDASTPPVLDLAEEQEPATAVEIGRLRALGELYGYRLDKAVRRAWADYTAAPKLRDCAWAVDAAARYWPDAEAEFWKHVDAREFVGAAAAFRTIAEDAYDKITYTALGTLRGAKAAARARVELYGGPAKTPAKAAATRPGTPTEDK
ncbi:hypothetical protein GCM10025734_62210 [Kitasatospora paranensis]|uniref:type I-E CRISPR-associated protein Cse1/CasA n=1 Tax=Kitasatospora paranensis TaxID=258053 RepID=UPI0031F11377